MQKDKEKDKKKYKKKDKIKKIVVNSIKIQENFKFLVF